MMLSGTPSRHLDRVRVAELVRRELLPRPVVHSCLAPLVALATTYEDRATRGIEVRFGKCECFPDSQTCPPEHHDQSAQPRGAGAFAGGTHDGDDLLDPRWVSGIAPSLVARRATRQVARNGRG